MRAAKHGRTPAGRTHGYPGLAGHRDARGIVALRAVAARRFLIVRRGTVPAVAHLQQEVGHAVIGFLGDVLQLPEDPGPDPLAAPFPDRGGRAGAVDDRRGLAAEPQDLMSFSKVIGRRSALVASQPMRRVIDRPVGQQRGELVPSGSSSRRPAGESRVVAAAGAQVRPHASSTGLRHAGEGPAGRRRGIELCRTGS